MLIMALVQIPRFLNAGDLIKTTIVGKGKPMILIHGMSCSSAVWDEVVEQFKNDYQLHVVTIAGFGNQEERETDHILMAVRDELIDYIKNEKLKKPIMMGHSMGGFLSLWVAATAPELVGKVVSVDGVPYFPALQMPGATPELMKPMAEQMTTMMQNMDAEARKANQDMMIATMIASIEKRPAVVKMGLDSNSKMTGQAYVEMFLTDIRDNMQSIQAPVLVLGAWAAYKNFGATKESVTMGFMSQVQKIPDVKVAVAEKAYHFIFYDEPEWFFEQVNNFLY